MKEREREGGKHLNLALLHVVDLWWAVRFEVTTVCMCGSLQNCVCVIFILVGLMTSNRIIFNLTAIVCIVCSAKLVN